MYFYCKQLPAEEHETKKMEQRPESGVSAYVIIYLCAVRGLNSEMMVSLEFKYFVKWHVKMIYVTSLSCYWQKCELATPLSELWVACLRLQPKGHLSEVVSLIPTYTGLSQNWNQICYHMKVKGLWNPNGKIAKGMNSLNAGLACQCIGENLLEVCKNLWGLLIVWNDIRGWQGSELLAY